MPTREPEPEFEQGTAPTPPNVIVPTEPPTEPPE